MDLITSPAAKNKTKRVERAVETQTKMQHGQCGAEYIDDNGAASTHTGPYYALQSVGTADAILDQSDMETANGSAINYDNFDTDITIPNGSTIFGHFIGISLVSGAIIAYKEC
jgi:hypothetical protein